MRHPTIVDQVRLLVEHTFQELRISTEGGLEETILIRNGFYCGRRFAVEGAHAIWFCEENQLKFYGESGSVLRVLQGIDQQLQNSASPLADVA